MYEMLNHSHSGLRWIVLILLILAIVNALMKWLGKNEVYTTTDKKLGLWAMSMTHLQFILGMVLYVGFSPFVQFTSEAMKDATLRFYTVEHFSMMILAVILITIGYSVSKRKTEVVKKHRSLFTYYFIALLIILAAIPWPFREGLGGGWF